MDQSTSDLLKAKGLRSTAQRRAVLSALRGHPHSTAAELESRIPATGDGSGSGSRTGDGAGNGDRAGDGSKDAAAGRGAPARNLSRQGLYNVLEDLTRAQLIRCIEPAGSPARYELRVGDNHHHLVCRSCGRIEDVDCSVGRAPCLEPGDDAGFSIDEAEVTWWGLCADCRTDRPATRH